MCVAIVWTNRQQITIFHLNDNLCFTFVFSFLLPLDVAVLFFSFAFSLPLFDLGVCCFVCRDDVLKACTLMDDFRACVSVCDRDLSYRLGWSHSAGYSVCAGLVHISGPVYLPCTAFNATATTTVAVAVVVDSTPQPSLLPLLLLLFSSSCGPQFDQIGSC